MSEKSQAKNFVEGIFKAEENSAEALDKSKLNQYSNIAIKVFNTPVLAVKEMIYPGVGEFAKHIFTALEQLRTLYFVNVLKIDLTYVVWIDMLITLYNVLNDPLMGMVYDRTRTRWGKARPYVVSTSIPYYLSTLILYSGALFLGDTSGNDNKKIVFVFVVLFVQETFSTIYQIPRDNMLSLQTANPDDRIKVGLIQQYVGYTASQLTFVFFNPLMEMSNKGIIKFPLSVLFFIFAAFSAAVGVVGNTMMGIKCKERLMLQPKPAPITKTMFYVLKNKYMLRNFLAGFVVNWWSNGGYKWDVVTQQEIFGGVIPSFFAYIPNVIITYLSVGFIPWFKKIFKNNNRNGVVISRLWDLGFYVIMVAVGLPFVDKKYVIMAIFAFCYGMNAVNDGPARVFEAELGREINDYTEYVTGERPDGTIGLLTSLISHVTKPLNTLLTIKLFSWSGYDTTQPMLPWQQGSKLVYQKVFFLFMGVNLFPDFIRIIPYFFYDLVGEKRERMYIALNERRALLTDQDEENPELEEIIESISDKN